MHSMRLGFGLVIAAVSAFAGGEARAQHRTQHLVINAPITAKKNEVVTLTASLTDAVTGHALEGRLVTFSHGHQRNVWPIGDHRTSKQGIATRTWRFADRGRYQFTAFVNTGQGYFSQRAIHFVDVK